jgi:hypothetical protein
MAGGAAARMTRLAGGASGDDGGSFGGGFPGGGFPGEGAARGELPGRVADMPPGLGGDPSSRETGLPRLSSNLPRAAGGDFGGDGSGEAIPLPVRQPGGSSQTRGPSGGSMFTRPGVGDDLGTDGGSAASPFVDSPAAPGVPGSLPGRGGDPELPVRGHGDLPQRGGDMLTRGPGGDPPSRGALPARGGGDQPFRGNGGSSGPFGSDGSSVTVPPAAGPAQEPRLPIFDSLETDWFRRIGTSAESNGGGATTSTGSWNSAADDGWRAAQAAAAPNSSETTTAGLPKRVPRANLVPGSVGGEDTPEAEPPNRSPDAMRNRMASFQRGVREARAAGPQNEEP